MTTTHPCEKTAAHPLHNYSINSTNSSQSSNKYSTTYPHTSISHNPQTSITNLVLILTQYFTNASQSSHKYFTNSSQSSQKHFTSSSRSSQEFTQTLSRFHKIKSQTQHKALRRDNPLIYNIYLYYI